MDVESLQADVNAGRFLTAQPEAAQLPLPSAEEIGKQLKTGILHQTAQGKSEFIVRLEPEGIGEIVVKISDDREHMALSIFTASTQAARLISNEVATLQEALRPLQVQVQQVTLLPTEQAVSYASQSALTDQGQQQSLPSSILNSVSSTEADTGSRRTTALKLLSDRPRHRTVNWMPIFKERRNSR